MKHCWDRRATYNYSWWRFAVRKATSVVKYMMFGTFIIALDRLHQKYGRKRTSSSMSSETSVRSDVVLDLRTCCVHTQEPDLWLHDCACRLLRMFEL